MTHSNAKFGTHQRGGNCGIYISIYQDPIRRFRDYDLFQAAHNFCGLLGLASRAHLQVDIGRGHAQFLKKNVGHIKVIVLPGVHQYLTNASLRVQRPNDGRSFHEIGAGADDVQNFHQGLREYKREP